MARGPHRLCHLIRQASAPQHQSGLPTLVPHGQAVLERQRRLRLHFRPPQHLGRNGYGRLRTSGHHQQPELPVMEQPRPAGLAALLPLQILRSLQQQFCRREQHPKREWGVCGRQLDSHTIPVAAGLHRHGLLRLAQIPSQRGLTQLRQLRASHLYPRPLVVARALSHQDEGEKRTVDNNPKHGKGYAAHPGHEDRAACPMGRGLCQRSLRPTPAGRRGPLPYW